MDNAIEGKVLTPMPKAQSKPETMDFAEAIKEIIKGNKVARLEWNNADYCLLKDEWLGIFRNGRFYTHWNVSQGDMEGEDWVIVGGSN